MNEYTDSWQVRPIRFRHIFSCLPFFLFVEKAKLFEMLISIYQFEYNFGAFFGMGNAMSSSFAPECTEAKKEYDDCFNNWYTEKFLKGKSLYNECEDLWYDYKSCVDLALAKKGIMPMLEEAREEVPFDKASIVQEADDKKK